MSLNKVLVKSKEPHGKHCVGKRFNSRFETPIYIKFFKSSGSRGKPRNVKSYGHLKWPSLSRLILGVKGHGSMSRRLPHPLLRETYSSYLTCNSYWLNVSYGNLKMPLIIRVLKYFFQENKTEEEVSFQQQLWNWSSPWGLPKCNLALKSVAIQSISIPLYSWIPL